MFGFKRNKRTSLAKTMHDIEYKKAYLKQLKKEGARKGKEAAKAESRKTKQSESTMDKIQKSLAGGARFSEAFLGTGPPQRTNNKKRS